MSVFYDVRAWRPVKNRLQARKVHVKSSLGKKARRLVNVNSAEVEPLILIEEGVICGVGGN
jgi:hypothetical protein